MIWKEAAINFVKGVGKIVLLILIMILCLEAFTLYKVKPIRKFCDSISADATPASILADAQANGFITFDNMAQRGEVSVVNQKSPFWRFACIVKFKDGKVADKKVITAD